MLHPFERIACWRVGVSVNARPGARSPGMAARRLRRVRSTQPRPSAHNSGSLPGASQTVTAPNARSRRLRKPLTGVSASSLRGRPSGLVETADHEAVSCPPRGRDPACRRSAPRRDRTSSYLDGVRSGGKRRLPLAPRHHRHDLMLYGPRPVPSCLTRAELKLAPVKGFRNRRDRAFFAVTVRLAPGSEPELSADSLVCVERTRRSRRAAMPGDLAPGRALIETPTRQGIVQMAEPDGSAAGADEAVRPA